MSNVNKLAELVKHAPHSFQMIRAQSDLKLTDAQFFALIEANPDRFTHVRFAKKDDEGKPVKPGRPGVKLKDA